MSLSYAKVYEIQNMTDEKQTIEFEFVMIYTEAGVEGIESLGQRHLATVGANSTEEIVGNGGAHFQGDAEFGILMIQNGDRITSTLTKVGKINRAVIKIVGNGVYTITDIK